MFFKFRINGNPKRQNFIRIEMPLQKLILNLLCGNAGVITVSLGFERNAGVIGRNQKAWRKFDSSSLSRVIIIPGYIWVQIIRSVGFSSR